MSKLLEPQILISTDTGNKLKGGTDFGLLVRPNPNAVFGVTSQAASSAIQLTLTSDDGAGTDIHADTGATHVLTNLRAFKDVGGDAVNIGIIDRIEFAIGIVPATLTAATVTFSADVSDLSAAQMTNITNAMLLTDAGANYSLIINKDTIYENVRNAAKYGPNAFEWSWDYHVEFDGNISETSQVTINIFQIEANYTQIRQILRVGNDHNGKPLFLLSSHTDNTWRTLAYDTSGDGAHGSKIVGTNNAFSGGGGIGIFSQQVTNNLPEIWMADGTTLNVSTMTYSGANDDVTEANNWTVPVAQFVKGAGSVVGQRRLAVSIYDLNNEPVVWVDGTNTTHQIAFFNGAVWVTTDYQAQMVAFVTGNGGGVSNANHGFWDEDNTLYLSSQVTAASTIIYRITNIVGNEAIPANWVFETVAGSYVGGTAAFQGIVTGTNATLRLVRQLVVIGRNNGFPVFAMSDFRNGCIYKAYHNGGVSATTSDNWNIEHLAGDQTDAAPFEQLDGFGVGARMERPHGLAYFSENNSLIVGGIQPSALQEIKLLGTGANAVAGEVKVIRGVSGTLGTTEFSII